MNNFSKNGFIVENVLEDKEVKQFEDTFLKFCKMQIKKLNLNTKTNKVQEVVTLLNKKNPKALDEACLMVRNSSIGHKLAGNKKLLEISNKLLENKNSPRVISGPAFMINFPKNNQRKYTWHNEQIWYPKRRNFINVWCPIFEDRINKNSMGIKIGSHKKNWNYFSEYQGYNGKLHDECDVQYEIPENHLKGYKTVIPKVKKNEGIFFDAKTVHRSLNLKKKKVLFTITFRVYDYHNDLTLSANWADLPYNGKSFGMPNLNVDLK